MILHNSLSIILIFFLFFRPKKSKKSKKSKTKEKPDDDFEDGFDKIERERREDLEERDAFAQRVIKRDKEKQRNAAEKVKKNINTQNMTNPTMVSPVKMEYV